MECGYIFIVENIDVYGLLNDILSTAQGMILIPQS